VSQASLQPVSITLEPLNDSGMGGTATLTMLDNDRSRVQVLVTGSTSVHPAHIHAGRCPDVDPTPRWPLDPVQNGASTTELDVSLPQIATGEYAVEMHVSPSDLTPVACGNINTAS
jgi:hypothetical protein